MLQQEFAQKKGVQIDATTLRRSFNREGYKWLPRGKKLKYTSQQQAERQAFGAWLQGMSPKQFTHEINLCVDGVLTAPPRENVSREFLQDWGQLRMAQTAGAGPSRA